MRTDLDDAAAEHLALTIEEAIGTAQLSGARYARDLAARQIRLCRNSEDNRRWLEYWQTFGKALHGFKCVPDSWVELMTSNTSADQP